MEQQQRVFEDAVAKLSKMRITRHQRRVIRDLLGQMTKELERIYQDEVGQIKQAQEIELVGVATTLTEAIGQAMMASEMKSQFLANMSHELRTPLHAVIGYLDLVLANTESTNEATVIDDPDAKEYMESALNRARGLEEIINSLLDLSKIEAGRMEVTISQINVRGLAESMIHELEILALKKGINLVARVDQAMPEEIKSDKGMLKSIILNLLSNAIKFTEVGSVELIFRRAEAGWEIVVKDTGIGFDVSREEELWEPFIQLEGGSTRRHGGTGLGLALVKRLSKLLGGDVHVNSQVGTGSEFTVSLVF